MVTRRSAAPSARIWVASASALWVAEFTGAPATAIDARRAGLHPSRRPACRDDGWHPVRHLLALATDGRRVYVLGRSIEAGRSHAAAGRGLARRRVEGIAASLSATLLTGTPPDMFGSTDDQSSYDMCICTHPTVAGPGLHRRVDRRHFHGERRDLPLRDDGDALNPIAHRRGVHPDVHAPAGRRPVTGRRDQALGVDGHRRRGVLLRPPRAIQARSRRATTVSRCCSRGSSRTTRPIPASSSPGFQDNGTATRVGDGVWYQQLGGDGGGVVFDPASTNRYYRQYINASWRVQRQRRHPAGERRRNARKVDAGATSESQRASRRCSTPGAASRSAATRTSCSAPTASGARRDWGRLVGHLADQHRSARPVTTPTSCRTSCRQTSTASAQYTDRVGSVDCCSSNDPGIGMKGAGIVTVRLSAAPNDAAGNLVLRVVALYGGGLAWLTGTRAPAGNRPVRPGHRDRPASRSSSSRHPPASRTTSPPSPRARR